MSQKYYTILTEKGAALLANATALGVPLKLSQMAVGDGNGTMPNPIASQTKLVNEVRRAAINTISIDENNPNQIIAEQVIPENEGGWFIHEIGLFDDKGNLIAVGNCPATYKPKLAEGSGRTQIIRMIIIVDNVDSVAIKIDPSVVLATREYVERLLSSHKATTQQSFDSEIKKLVPNTRKINNKELKSDIKLLADDINALPAVKKQSNGQPTYEVGNQVNFENLRIKGQSVERFIISRGANANGWFEIYNDGFKRVGHKWPADKPLYSPTPRGCFIIPFPIAFTMNVTSVYASIETTTPAVEIINYAVYGLSKIGLTAASLTPSELTPMENFACSYTAEGY